MSSDRILAEAFKIYMVALLIKFGLTDAGIYLWQVQVTSASENFRAVKLQAASKQPSFLHNA